MVNPLLQINPLGRSRQGVLGLRQHLRLSQHDLKLATTDASQPERHVVQNPGRVQPLIPQYVDVIVLAEEGSLLAPGVFRSVRGHRQGVRIFGTGQQAALVDPLFVAVTSYQRALCELLRVVSKSHRGQLRGPCASWT